MFFGPEHPTLLEARVLDRQKQFQREAAHGVRVGGRHRHVHHPRVRSAVAARYAKGVPRHLFLL